MKRLAAALVLALALLPGCVQVGAPSGLPECAPAGGEVAGGVLLMAQSVPTASWVPCVVTMPVGWTFQGLDVESGVGRFWLDSDREGMRALGIELRQSCRTDGTTEVSSEQEGMRRFERVSQVSPGYVGKRYYTFAGGCVIFHFNLHGATRGEPLAAATQAIGFVSRQTLRDFVREQSDGRLSLDPSEST